MTIVVELSSIFRCISFIHFTSITLLILFEIVLHSILYLFVNVKGTIF